MYKFMWASILSLLIFLQNPIVLQEDVMVEAVKINTEVTHNTNRIIEVQTLERRCPYSEEEIYLIALVTLAEAEGECEEGKRLVIDTVLNRIDSSHFPNTVEEVIYQPYQFSSMWNDRYTRVTVTDDICDLVREEIYHRLNSEVIFFTADQYGKYGVPMFQVGNHYFSSYEQKGVFV